MEAIALIEEMQQVSLAGLARKGEAARHQQEEVNQQQHQFIKKILEAKQWEPTDPNTEASQNTSVGTTFPFSFNKPVETLSQPQYKEKPDTEIWEKPESIGEVIQELKNCEDSEMLQFILQSELPHEIYEMALGQLSSEKREQLRQWEMAEC